MHKHFFIWEAYNFSKAIILEEFDRIRIFNLARREADKLNLPLVNYGCRLKEPFASSSDFNLDIRPRNVPNFILIEPDGKIPLPDNSAVIFASHVIEHVDNPEIVLSEMQRVGPTFVVLPKWWSISNWVNPYHERIFIKKGEIKQPYKFSLPLLIGLNMIALIL